MLQKRVFIVGGAAVDIVAQIESGDFAAAINNSNIGAIQLRPGGSARNCAEALARLLGQENIDRLSFISSIGSEDHKTKGQFVRESLSHLGLEPDLQVVEGQRTAAFSGILDSQGEFKLGVADMKVLEKLEADFVVEVIEKSQVDEKLLVIDSNVHPLAIQEILNRVQAESILEPISNEKLQRILEH